MSGQTKSLRERFYTEEEKKAWFAALLIMLAGAVIIFGHEYYTVMKLMKSKTLTDMQWHADLAKSLRSFSLAEWCYPLWHWCVKGMLKIFHLKLKTAASFVSAAMVAATYVTSFFCIRLSTRKISPVIAAVINFFLFTAGALHIHAFNKYYYLGQGSPNIFHNPTHIAVRLFALPAFFILASILDKAAEKEFKENISKSGAAALAVLLVLSTLAKPTLLQVLYPALFFMFIWLMVKTHAAVLKNGIALILCCIPSVLILIYQYSFTFAGNGNENATESGMEFTFMGIWHLYTPSPLLSLILSSLFPLIIFGISIYRKETKLSFILAWMIYLIGFCEQAFLSETGDRARHFNFSWGFNLGLFLVWWLSAVYLVKSFRKRDKTFWICLAVFICHCGFGIYYAYVLLKDKKTVF